MEQKLDLFSQSSDEEISIEILLHQLRDCNLSTLKASSVSVLTNLVLPQPNVHAFRPTYLSVELPGIDDRERAKAIMVNQVNLEFYRVLQNDENWPSSQANDAVGAATNPELWEKNAPADSTLTEEQILLKLPLMSKLQSSLVVAVQPLGLPAGY